MKKTNTIILECNVQFLRFIIFIKYANVDDFDDIDNLKIIIGQIVYKTKYLNNK